MISHSLTLPQDYLYGDQLEAWGKAGDIKLYTAFSRQQVQGLCDVLIRAMDMENPTNSPIMKFPCHFCSLFLKA